MCDFLDAGGDESHLAGTELGDPGPLRREDADLLHVMFAAGGHHLDALTLLESPVVDPHEDDHPEIGVIPGIHEQGLERRLRVPLWRGQFLDDGLEQVVDAIARLSRN